MNNSDYTTTKIMRNSDFIKYMIEDRKNEESKLKETAALKKSEATESQRRVYKESVLDNKTKFNNNYNKFNNFIDDTNKMFLAESIYSIFSESVPAEYKKERSSEAFMRSIVYDFINENGVYNILNKIKYRSPYLSNLYNAITEATDEIKEDNDFDPSENKEYSISTSVIEKFADNINDDNKDEIIDIITKKVTEAIEEFVKQNQRDHEKIKELSQDASDKIDAEREKIDNKDLSEDELKEVEESYNILAKSKLAKIRNRPRSILESMVVNVGESVLKDDRLRDTYTIEGHVDMDKIMSKCVMFYTFLETVNTINLETVNDEYINEFLDALTL